MATKTQEKPGTSVTVVPRPEAVVQELQAKATGLVASCKALQVVTEEDLKTSASLRDRIAVALKALNDRRFEITRPLDAAKRSVMDLFGPVADMLMEADEMVKAQQRAFDAKRRAEEEAQRKVEEEAKRKRDEEERKRIEAANAAIKEGVKPETVISLMPPPPPPVAITPPAPKLTRAEDGAGVTFVDDPRFEIVDAALLPREYLVPDEAKIRKVVKAGVETIPGCRIWKERVPRRA